MIRRSCNSRFRQPILDDIKITTIREKRWPLGVPIMLFEWIGKPYRSKQLDIAVIHVISSIEIYIIHHEDGSITYCDNISTLDLWEKEGFSSQAEMDEWFSKVVKKGTCKTVYLMRFKRLVDTTATPTSKTPRTAKEWNKHGSLSPQCAAAFMELCMKLEVDLSEERDALVTAQLTIALIKQDLDTIREICMNAGTSTDVLKFLDTPTNNEQ